MEKMNKKLLRDTLLKKPQKRLNRLEFGSLYTIPILPVVALVAQHPNFTAENFEWKFILGCVLKLVVMAYLCIESSRVYILIKKIDLNTDPVLQ